MLLGYGAAGFFGNVLGGWLAERSLRGALIATGLVLGLSVLSLVMLGNSATVGTVALVLVWGMAFGMLPISLQSWMFGAAPHKLEAVQAMGVSVSQAAIGGGALLGGLLADNLGLASAMWLGSLCALAVTGALAAGRFWRREPACVEPGCRPSPEAMGKKCLPQAPEMSTRLQGAVSQE